jgi:phytoene dehydrogenase-like protein
MEASDIVIVGAGASGLQCAQCLMAFGVEPDRIIVLEASDYVGGRIKQNETFVDGYKVCKLGCAVGVQLHAR